MDNKYLKGISMSVIKQTWTLFFKLSLAEWSKSMWTRIVILIQHISFA